jgi:hypothetical protein
MAARNPSPPPISEQEADVLYSDNIGDTLFSRKWVLKVLFNATQQIKSDNENINVADSLDSELCELWDMSMNKVFSDYIQNYKYLQDLKFPGGRKTYMSQLPYLIVPKPTPTNYLVLLNNKNTEHN